MLRKALRNRYHRGREDRHGPSVMGLRSLHPALQMGRIVLPWAGCVCGVGTSQYWRPASGAQIGLMQPNGRVELLRRGDL
jgi:hypothetical protein